MANHTSEEAYQLWKEETLARQTSHVVPVQTTGLWKQFKDMDIIDKDYDKNSFVIEVAPGYR